MANENNNNFETLSAKETILKLETNEEKGLTSLEAQKRLEKYGPNKLEEKKKKSIIRIFLEQLMDPMIYVLFAAVLVTLLISIVNTVKDKAEGVLKKSVSPRAFKGYEEG